MHLHVLLILWLSQQLFAVGDNSSNRILGTARSLNDTSLPLNLENKNRESQDYKSDFPDDDRVPTTDTIANSTYIQSKNPISSFSTGKPVEIIIREFIPTIRNHNNSMTDPLVLSQQTGKLKEIMSNHPVTSPEPKTTPQGILDEMVASSSKSKIGESSTSLLSKDSTIRRETPFPNSLIRSFVESNTNSSSGSGYIRAEEHANTKSPIYLKSQTRTVRQTEFFFTMSNEQFNLSHNDQDSINGSSEMTNPLHDLTDNLKVETDTTNGSSEMMLPSYVLHLSDNLKNVTDATEEAFESPEVNEANKTKKFSMNTATPKSPLGWINSNFHLSSDYEDSINESSKIATPLYDLHLLDNLKNETVTKPTIFEPTVDNEVSKTKELSMNVTMPYSSTERGKVNFQLSSNGQDSMTSSSEVTLLNKWHPSLNLTNEADGTRKFLQSTGDYEVNKTKELLTNVTSSKDQNNENLDTFLSKRQDKSASIDNQQQDANVLSRSVTTSNLSLNSNSELSDLPSTDTTINISENQASSNPDLKFNSEIASETASTTLTNYQTSYENLSEPTDTNIIFIENRTSFVMKEDEEYTVTVPRICSNYSTINRLLNLLNVSPNNKKPTNFTCENLKDMTIVINSKELFYKINELLKAEAKTDDMVFIKVSPNATIAFEINSHSSNDGVFIPMTAIVIFGGASLFILFVILCVSLYKMKCRKHSTSLDLHNIPHLNLKTDYNLTPIPRPSISFPDNNRDFLHAYASDNYSLSRQDNTLQKRTCSGTMAKTYEEVQREIGSKQEMQTFTMSSGRKSEFRASRSQDYPSSHSWDRLQENNYSKKFGVDNPGYRRW